MPGHLYIPDEVLRSIRAHVDAAVARAESGYRSVQEEEDAGTGALFGALRIETQFVNVPEGDPPGIWRWSIEYSKFGSKGADSTETIVGADGILQLRVSGANGEQQKSALFQAKNTLKRDPRLLEQAAKLSLWREAAFVIGFAPDNYVAFTLDEIVRTGGALSQANGERLSHFITGEFIPCRVGHFGLYYDLDQRKLYWAVGPRTSESPWDYEWVSVDFAPKHLVRIDVQQPHIGRSRAREIEFSKIARNRLKVTPRELFGLQGSLTIPKLRSRRAELLRTYHPDQSNHLKPEFRKLLDARVIEINDAYEELRSEFAKQTRRSRTTGRRSTSTPELKESSSSPPFVVKKRSQTVTARSKKSGDR